MRSKGLYSTSVGFLRFQFYWPEIKIVKGEFQMSLDTNLRIVSRTGLRERYFGGGFNLLGFGCGFDYCRPLIAAEIVGSQK